MRQCDVGRSPPQKSGENLEGRDVRDRCGQVDQVFDLGEFMGRGVELDKISWFWKWGRGEVGLERGS
jgi:hypothetical protein